LRKGHKYIIINVSYAGMCVEFERKKTTQHWFPYFQIARKYYMCVKIFYD